MKKFLLLSLFGIFTPGLDAGDWGKAPAAKAPVEECLDIGGEISTGYDTDYMFYGARFARDSVWTDVNYTFDNLVVPVTLGAWYLNGINAPANYDELDLYAFVEVGSYAGFDASLGYTHFFFPETGPAAGFGSTGEASLELYRDLGFADFNGRVVYFFAGGLTPGGGGFYYEAALEKSFGLTDKASLVVGAGVGYSDNYFFGFSGDSGWNHYFATVSLPIELNCRTTLTPYISYNGAPDTWVIDTLGLNSDVLYGGVSITVSF